MKFSMFRKETFVRVAPFVAFMVFIAVEEVLRTLLKHRILSFDETALYWLYLPKAVLVGSMLLMFRCNYAEIKLADLLNYRFTVVSALSGMLVFYLWINMDWTLGATDEPVGFDPIHFTHESARWLMVIVRVAGAVIIVPIMEELFWRSFLLRYLIDSDFTKVTIGRFSLFSFIAVSILFGLEHHYVFAGIMAGVVFNCVYYYTKSIVQCILSHAAANLFLALYVLSSGNWNFW